MPLSLQSNSRQQQEAHTPQAFLARLGDYVAEMVAAEYPHWQEMPMTGENSHRRFAWTGDDGIAHMTSCGSGLHSEADSKQDQRMLRSRIRICESGACGHRPSVDAFAAPLSPEESAIKQPTPFTLGQKVVLNNEPHFITEYVPAGGGVPAIYGVLHATNGSIGTATEEELRPDGATNRQANILDPVHDGLDPDVWDHPDSDSPLLRPEHKQWIVSTIYKHLDDAGYDGMDEWLSLVFTGSLTTYQYSPDSDVDVSLFVDTVAFPDWSRAEMIGVMVNHLDGTNVPGTTHPIQCFVVPPEVSREDLYRPGLRSGYDVESDLWVQPPERDRVMDVEHEMNTAYTLALESADKMELLLKYEPQEAVRYWHHIHDKRREDHQAGKGDFSPSNIVYKMLANRGLFEEISEVSGEHIAGSDLPPVLAFFLNIKPEDYPFNPKIRKRLMQTVDKYDWLHTPEGEALIMMLGGFYPKETDRIASWLVRQWKEGSIVLPPGLAAAHRQGEHWFSGKQPWEVVQSRYLFPGDTEEKMMRGEEIEPIQQGMVERLPAMLQHLKDRGRGLDLNQMSWDDIVPIFEQWNAQQERDPDAGETLMSFPEHTMREVRAEECPDEGQRMKNCAATYSHKVAENTHRVLSLRDLKNESLATITLSNRGEIEDAKGKANSPIRSEHVPYVSQFLQTLPNHVMMGSPNSQYDIPDKEQYGLPVWEPWTGQPHPHGKESWYSPEQYNNFYPRVQQ